MSKERKKVLLACTGSVATVKLSKLVNLLKTIPVDVRIVMTEHSKHFVNAEMWEQLDDDVTVYSDTDEWDTWQKMGDKVLHIELAKWADLLLIAPLGAHSMAKIANGLCDNLLTCMVRAWDFKKPHLFAPAMNTVMWNHPITKEHVEKLTGWQYVMIPPVSKKLACGDFGVGAMAEVETIVERVKLILDPS